MSSTDNAEHVGVCANVGNCTKAFSGEVIEWYRGAGEYCPECGEALTPHDASAIARLSDPVPMALSPEPSPHALAHHMPIIPDAPPSALDLGQTAVTTRRKPAFMTPRRWLWFIAGLFVVGAGFSYAWRRSVVVDPPAADTIAVCAIPSAQQLAVDLVRAYAAHSGISANRFVVTNARVCDVRFSALAQAPQAVIARDGIVAIVNPLNAISRVSESQLRAIFSGVIRDWSQLGGPHGTIVAFLPDASSDEAQALAASLFFGVPIDSRVRRSGSSADVTRAVTGADRTSRGAIGLVTFSQAVTAKVVPLAYLPPPSVLSISSRRYPYTLSIGIETGTANSTPAAMGLIGYARSGDGAAIVLKNGLIPREGL